MTTGSAKRPPIDRPPILVLGLGNLLLHDDGLGLKLLERVEADAKLDGRDFGSLDLESEVEFVDGGTQGLALLGYLDGRRLILVLDAIGLGGAPGTVHVLNGDDIGKLRFHRSTSAHEGNALELLVAARLLGTELGEVVIVGIEPEHIRTGVGLSPRVSAAVPEAVAIARTLIVSVSNPSLCA